ncbi:MAG: sigma-70 family RNA polymerase sigma factor [Planctomycetes bacterium]|nr:sigma-70 family RNA polymerase sigma factor [Planctomycetota bacterium]
MGPPGVTRAVIEKAQAGDRAAFDALVAAHRDRIERHVRESLGARLRGRCEVDDVLQETFLRAFQSLGRFEWRDEGSFLSWLKTIASHVVLEAASRDARDLSVPLERDVPDSCVEPEKELRRAERFDRLEAALEGLSPEHRQVIRLARLEKLPLKEVARRMDRTPNAVKQLLWRALQKLQAAFGDTESLHLPPRSLESSGGPHGE